MPRSLAPSSTRAIRPAAPARLKTGKVIQTDQLPPVTIRPHFGSVSTATIRTLSQSASSSSASMRARAVPICWPISARMMLTVTMPSRSMLYQMVGSKAVGTAATAESVAASADAKPNANPAPAMPIRKARRDGENVSVKCWCSLVIAGAPSELGCRLLDRLADADIGHATAQVSRHDAVNVLIGRTGEILQQRRGLHNLARLAIAALRHLQIDQAFCNGWRPSGSSPSIVVTSAPGTFPTGVMQDRVGRPPTCTVQAPHMPMQQPNLVPVRPMTSRMTHNSGVSSSTSTVTGRPLTWNVIMLNNSG